MDKEKGENFPQKLESEEPSLNGSSHQLGQNTEKGAETAGDRKAPAEELEQPLSELEVDLGMGERLKTWKKKAD